MSTGTIREEYLEEDTGKIHKLIITYTKTSDILVVKDILEKEERYIEWAELKCILRGLKRLGDLDWMLEAIDIQLNN